MNFGIPGHEPSLLPDGDWRLAWSDEFDGNALDTSKWNFRLNFWGHRFSAYTDEGVVVNGNSELEIHLVERDGEFASAQLQTGANSWDNLIRDFSADKKNLWGGSAVWRGSPLWPLRHLEKPKFSHRFGYYECRCKFQQHPEAWWSAFWLQAFANGSTPDPAWSGLENDIMECFKPGLVTSGNFYGGVGEDLRSDCRIVDYPLAETLGGWHRFGMEWSEKGYVFYVDGVESARSDGRFTSLVPQFILLTTEPQGYRNEGCASPLLASAAPDHFTVDYVRVFDRV